MLVSIPVVTRLQDNGDGGYTMFAYNNEDELIADHYETRRGKMTPELRKRILNGEDEYEYGYMGTDTIELEVSGDCGEAIKIQLAKPLIFHGGQ